METKIEDVIHHYIGCEVDLSPGNWKYICKLSEVTDEIAQETGFLNRYAFRANLLLRGFLLEKPEEPNEKDYWKGDSLSKPQFESGRFKQEMLQYQQALSNYLPPHTLILEAI